MQTQGKNKSEDKNEIYNVDFKKLWHREKMQVVVQIVKNAQIPVYFSPIYILLLPH